MTDEIKKNKIRRQNITPAYLNHFYDENLKKEIHALSMRFIYTDRVFDCG